jgi:hypothetical protein
MSGKYFKKIGNNNVDITTLFQAEGSSGTNDYFPDLDISNTKKDAGTPYARPIEFGYKIKGTGGEPDSDLSEYCNMTPTVYVRDATTNAYEDIVINISNYNLMSGYIVGGSSGGGGGSGGVVEIGFWSNDHHKGGDGGHGGGGDVIWFADYDISSRHLINMSLGARGNGGNGGNGSWWDSSNGGGTGGTGRQSVLKVVNGISIYTSGITGGGGGTPVNQNGNGGNTGNHITPQRQNEPNYTTWNSNWSYDYVPTFNNLNAIKASGNGGAGIPITDNPIRTHHGTWGGGGGPKGNNSGANGGDGGVGEPGYAVLYLKR